METILIVEDDKEIRTLEYDYLSASGYTVFEAADGAEALMKFENEKPNLVILDIILPIIDGFELCRRIRKESDVPIIMVSSKQEDTDKILALGLGADDYMEKPFSPSLMVAKVKATLRRYSELSGKTNSNIITVGNVSINASNRIVTVSGVDVFLSAKEFDLLYYLMENRNNVLSKNKIFDAVWGMYADGDPSTVTVHIKKIREKIEKDKLSPFIETVWGVGYVIRSHS